MQMQVNEFNNMKYTFGHELATRLSKINNDVNTIGGRMDIVIQGSQAMFTETEEERP